MQYTVRVQTNYMSFVNQRKEAYFLPRQLNAEQESPLFFSMAWTLFHKELGSILNLYSIDLTQDKLNWRLRSTLWGTDRESYIISALHEYLQIFKNYRTVVKIISLCCVTHINILITKVDCLRGQGILSSIKTNLRWPRSLVRCCQMDCAE